MTCVCFAEPSSSGVTEPFLTQKRPFLSRPEPFLTLWTLNYVIGFSYENLALNFTRVVLNFTRIVLNFTRVVLNFTRVVLNFTRVLPRSSPKAGYTVGCTQLSLVLFLVNLRFVPGKAVLLKETVHNF
jgi:hypothetical protein